MTDATTQQPLPKPGQEVVLFHVLDDFKRRAETGKAQYGTYLETHNGRDALVDAYQEALDLCMYLKQTIMERDAEQRRQYHIDMQAKIQELAK
jgi:hypothetical protein